ncbi:GNAT family N-acetyltransferase [Paenibacillus xylanexedens]|uniref:GNAT family N-acetyltransferase n=1 Tax=Paenibacillus xylanexedens TaxID=528191 RepID=UPI0011AB06B8|nr:GNAT family N-acetyltransferase [Paenibacillus xylanexedens]
MTHLVQIERIQPDRYKIASELMAYGFGHKFQRSTAMSLSDLATAFEQMLHHVPQDTGNLRVVAREDDVIVGTMSLKWKPGSHEQIAGKVRGSQVWDACYHIGTLRRLLMLTGIHLLKHEPVTQECYIEDIVVHPQHQSKGIGRQLLAWAQQYMLQSRQMSYLSLHVASHNLKAIQMYERLQFHTQNSTKSWMTGMLLGEQQWNYMTRKGDDHAST